MKFDALHENLRLEILRRIERGALSGSALARATGFRQAHISNFLNRKRSLSLEGLDRVLVAQNLSILDLLPADAAPSVALDRHPASLTRTVPVVTYYAASTAPRLPPHEILDTVEVPDAVLHFSPERPATGKSLWQRFVAVRVDAILSAAMDPLLPPNCTAVIDRHYNTLGFYRAHPPTIYAVYATGSLHLCFIEFEANRLILRPRNSHVPVRLVELSPNELPGDRIVGRICYVLSEL